jgi:macrolide transport system ATP-binding/permease protein
MIRVLLSKLFGAFRHRFFDRDFDTEIETHLEMLLEENVRRGMGLDEARQAALRSLGNLTSIREHQREERGLPQIETLFTDLKYAARVLLATPGFTLIATLTLTLGVSAVTTVFTAYDAVALKPLPVADPSQVVRLERWFANSRGDIQYLFSYPEYLYCRDRNDVFAGLVAASGVHAVAADDTDKLAGELVTANYFTDLGVPAQIGRTFLPGEDRAPGGNPVTVLSNAFWERRFHDDREVAGRIVKLNGVAFTVVGVAAKDFSGTSVVPQTPDFWAPFRCRSSSRPGATG